MDRVKIVSEAQHPLLHGADRVTYSNISVPSVSEVAGTLDYLITNQLAGGNGDVFGPASSTDNALARFDGVSGKLIQNSGATLSDLGVLTASGFVGDVTGNVSGSAGSFTGSLVGDVTGTQGATVVSNLALSKLAALTINRALISSGAGVIAVSAVTATELGYLTGATSNIQAQIDALVAGSGITQLTGDVTAGPGAGSQAATVVSVGGSLAAAINTATVLANAATSANTASTIVKRDGSGNFVAGTITANLTGNASGSAASFTGSLVGDVTGTQGATVISNLALSKLAALTVDRALISSGAGVIAVSAVTAVELGYVSGATSNIQAQINVLAGGGGITQLTGDVLAGPGSGSQAATVAFVGGSSAANVNAAELLANAATNLNTASTIVKRDGSGNFVAGTITANITGNVSGSAASFTGSLVGDVTGTQAATVVSTVGGSSAANVNTATITANAATNLNTASTIVKRDASGNFSAGTITASLSGNATNITGQINLTSQVTGVLPVANGGTNKSSWTAGNVVFSSSTSALGEDATSQFTWDNTNKRLSVGATGTGKINITAAGGTDLGLNVSSTAANSAAQIQNQSGYSLALVNAAASALAGASIGGAFSRGTLASRTQSLSGDQVFSITGQGYTGSAFGPGFTSALSFVLSENTTASANGGEIVLSTTPNGSLTPVERLRIKNSGVITVSNLTASRPVKTDASKNLVSALIDLTSSNDVTGVLPIASGGTGAATASANLIFSGPSSGGAAAPSFRTLVVADLPALTASRAVVTNGSGLLTVSASTATEVGYLSGVTSAIQTQLNGKQASGNYITNLTGDVTASGPGSVAATVAFVGGSTAANIATAEALANAATALNTASAIVKRDGSGNFVAGTITANITGNVSGSAGSFTGSLVGDVTGTQGATVISNLALSKLAALTVSRALVSDGSGIISVSAVTASELAFVSGVTSAIQTQFSAKVTGPVSATDNAIARFDLTTGKLIQDSGASIDDSGNITATNLSGTNTGDQNNHTLLSNLTSGDSGHTQFAMLAGRAGGQTLQGGTAASQHLNLESTAHATKGFVKTKDSLVAFTDASFSGTWSGADLGGSSNYFRDLYTKGELKGARLQNFTSGTLPASAAENAGRSVWSTDNKAIYVDNGSAFQKVSYSKFVSDVSFDGVVTQVDVTVSASITDARNAIIQLLDNANSFERIFCKIQATSASNVRIITNLPLAAGSYRLIVID